MLSPDELDGLFIVGFGAVILIGITAVNALNPRARTPDGNLAGCMAWGVLILILGAIALAALGIESAGPVGIVPR